MQMTYEEVVSLPHMRAAREEIQKAHIAMCRVARLVEYRGHTSRAPQGDYAKNRYAPADQAAAEYHRLFREYHEVTRPNALRAVGLLNEKA